MPAGNIRILSAWFIRIDAQNKPTRDRTSGIRNALWRQLDSTSGHLSICFLIHRCSTSGISPGTFLCKDLAIYHSVPCTSRSTSSRDSNLFDLSRPRYEFRSLNTKSKRKFYYFRIIHKLMNLREIFLIVRRNIFRAFSEFKWKRFGIIHKWERLCKKNYLITI